MPDGAFACRDPALVAVPPSFVSLTSDRCQRPAFSVSGLMLAIEPGGRGRSWRDRLGRGAGQKSREEWALVASEDRGGPTSGTLMKLIEVL